MSKNEQLAYQPLEETEQLPPYKSDGLPAPVQASAPPSRPHRVLRAMIGTVLIFASWVFLSWCLASTKKHHHGHKKCAGDLISQHLPEGYEPSDLVWDKDHSTLYAVSDNGRIAGLDIGGKLVGEWKLNEKFDLEGVAIVPNRHDVLYLGHEHPATIYEFNLTSSKIQRQWPLNIPKAEPDCDAFTTLKANGIESVVFIASDKSSNGGFFYVGRQCDAKVFVFDLDLNAPFAVEMGEIKNGTANYRGSMLPPGPAYDLSAMTAFRKVLYFVYDVELEVRALSLKDRHNIPPRDPSKAWDIDARKSELKGHRLSFDRKGYEGMTFAEYVGRDGQDEEAYVFMAVDQKKGRKEIRRWEMRRFLRCFEDVDL